MSFKTTPQVKLGPPATSSRSGVLTNVRAHDVRHITLTSEGTRTCIESSLSRQCRSLHVSPPSAVGLPKDGTTSQPVPEEDCLRAQEEVYRRVLGADYRRVPAAAFQQAPAVACRLVLVVAFQRALEAGFLEGLAAGSRLDLEVAYQQAQAVAAQRGLVADFPRGPHAELRYG